MLYLTSTKLIACELQLHLQEQQEPQREGLQLEEHQQPVVQGDQRTYPEGAQARIYAGHQYIIQHLYRH
jgi:hypothetical protein